MLLTLGVTGSMWRLDAREDAPPQREFTLNARRYAFNPAHLEVTQDDIVKITLHAEDIAHSFTIDSYRIAKRAGAGQTVTFEFRADQVGRFPFYCNLTNDERCREMRGELVVRPR
ncbi:MAG: cupredoxin domain-containing protein [Acidobacteria bacterium]|nr:cupredoxin domain-containing protein [Acidobacteriota bacterium]